VIRNVEQARKQLRIAMAVLVVLDVALIALIMSPSIRPSSARQQWTALEAELAQKRTQTIPALDMDKKLAEAREQIAQFYSRDFAGRYSEISLALSKAADESHVEVANIKYDNKANEGKQPPAGGKLTQVALSLDLAGNYENEIRFINSLERSKLLLVIDSINLAESQGGGVRLSLKLETYLRTAGL
jgi:hypothetical protein